MPSKKKNYFLLEILKDFNLVKDGGLMEAKSNLIYRTDVVLRTSIKVYLMLPIPLLIFCLNFIMHNNLLNIVKLTTSSCLI